ncbi:pectin acetylesterase 8-like [Nicotiana tabacum]|uniref:Pectin acetylesterase n=2 Tax=Nicotiana TaxID=4085 RepID=A0A1S3ZMA7_TOBAC|nr:PREDICTED: protein notum homolog [Nicotiana sylvestris]XP_016465497.1 PREDICTED: pectin acetylesterase 8-like [Nicotiana tabacum]
MVMATRCLQLFCLIVCSLAIIKTESATDLDFYEVKKTIVKNAVSKGAVCLDGSPPAYHFEPGFGEGVGNWFVQLAGGAWCTSVETCKERIRDNKVGSTTIMGPFTFQGIYSKNQSANPDFYNWNKVLVRYCDGGAFTGDVEYVDPATNLHFRGARIFEAVVEDVLAKGLKNAKNAILAGSSAGGYPAMLYCDHFRSLLPNTPRVKCFVDGGYFIHAKNQKQARGFEEIYNGLVTLHGSGKTLPKSCTSKMKPLLCLFPENMQQNIKIPLFIAMSAFDIFQINTTVEPNLHDVIENGTCTTSQNKAFREFRSEFLSTLPKPNNPKMRGVFIDSVNHHTSLLTRWSPENATMINNLSLPKAFGDWYFDRKYWYVIDEHDLPISKKHEHDGRADP